MIILTRNLNVIIPSSNNFRFFLGPFSLRFYFTDMSGKGMRALPHLKSSENHTNFIICRSEKVSFCRCQHTAGAKGRGVWQV